MRVEGDDCLICVSSFNGVQTEQIQQKITSCNSFKQNIKASMEYFFFVRSFFHRSTSMIFLLRDQADIEVSEGKYSIFRIFSMKQIINIKLMLIFFLNWHVIEQNTWGDVLWVWICTDSNKVRDSLQSICSLTLFFLKLTVSGDLNGDGGKWPRWIQICDFSSPHTSPWKLLRGDMCQLIVCKDRWRDASRSLTVKPRRKKWQMKWKTMSISLFIRSKNTMVEIDRGHRSLENRPICRKSRNVFFQWSDIKGQYSFADHYVIFHNHLWYVGQLLQQHGSMEWQNTSLFSHHLKWKQMYLTRTRSRRLSQHQQLPIVQRWRNLFDIVLRYFASQWREIGANRHLNDCLCRSIRRQLQIEGKTFLALENRLICRRRNHKE